MKLGFAYLLTLSLVVHQTVAQGYTSRCPTMLPYYCDSLDKCVKNASACGTASTTYTSSTQSPCANSGSTLKYWCAPLKRCMANGITCANMQAALSGTTAPYGTSTTYGTVTQSSGSGTGTQSYGSGTGTQSSGYGTGTQSSGYGAGTQSSGYGTSSSTSACANSSYKYWCDATQNCVLSAAACPSALYTSFTGPATLDCVDNSFCKAYLSSQGRCPNDSISMGSYYVKMNDGHYTIGEGCTVTCRGCTDSGTYIAPSGTSVASGYVYGGTNVNGPSGGGGGNNNVAINTPNGVASFNPNTGTTTYTSGGGGGGGGGGAGGKNNGPHGRKLRGA